MPPIYLFEDSQVDRLHPLTYCRAACELRAGALTLLQRFQKNIGVPLAGLFVRDGLDPTVRSRVNLPVNPSLSVKDGVILFNARFLLLAGHAPWKDVASIPTNSAGLSQSTIVWIHLAP